MELIKLSNFKYVGERIKMERKKRSLTLKDLCEGTGLSLSLLSQIENGKITPSLSALDKIATYFSIHISSLFLDYSDTEIIHYKSKDHITIANGSKRELKLIRPKIKEMENVHLTIQSNATDHEYTNHKGIEFVYVIKGEVCVKFFDNEEEYVCEKGDSLLYHAKKKHKIINKSEKIAECIIVNLPKVNILQY